MKDLGKGKEVKGQEIYSDSDDSDGCRDCGTTSEVTEEEEFTGIVSKMNIDDEFYLLTRKETGESFVCNMSLEELGETILEEECFIKEHGGEISSLSKRQKFLCTCGIYHEVLDESVCDATKQVLQEMKDGE